jgi:hypothetical protein
VRNKKNMDNNNGNVYPKRLLKLSCGRVRLQSGVFLIERRFARRVVTGLTKKNIIGESFFTIRLNRRANASLARKKAILGLRP